MIRTAHEAGKLREVHIADGFNHRANDGNRYIINPPGADVTVHQHNEVGNGEVDWDAVFSTLRDISALQQCPWLKSVALPAKFQG